MLNPPSLFELPPTLFELRRTGRRTSPPYGAAGKSWVILGAGEFSIFYLRFTIGENLQFTIDYLRFTIVKVTEGLGLRLAGILQKKRRKKTKMRKQANKGTTKAGYINENGQKNLGRIEPPRVGTDHDQYIHVINCTRCGVIYGSNGSDIFQRKCPKCQRGAKGPKLLIS